MAPMIKRVLSVCKIVEAAPGENFCFKGAVEALIFAIGLWMRRRTVADADAQTRQPDRELG